MSVCFFGDGLTNIGVFYEVLNMVVVWRLFVIFICENNFYGEYLLFVNMTLIDYFVDRVAFYGFDCIQVDG